jgi:hypothetical protein
MLFLIFSLWFLLQSPAKLVMIIFFLRRSNHISFGNQVVSPVTVSLQKPVVNWQPQNFDLRTINWFSWIVRYFGYPCFRMTFGVCGGAFLQTIGDCNMPLERTNCR